MSVSEDALVREWTGFAYSIADRYYLPGADRDDCRQEALIGLLSGIRDWRPGHACSYKSFLELCIKRRVQTALKAALTQRSKSLTDAARVGRDELHEPVPILDLLPDVRAETLLDDRDRLRVVVRHYGEMPERDRVVLSAVANGESYEDISARLGIAVKRVDNVLFEARASMRRRLAA